ncbi:MAG: two pore domain potassium channel family protein [Nostoc sp. NOS(2021)]|uniref:potassium channel family protein n=1 Tax=Nostoc sp. NOS(2021) TaxID=2815407 RepID=UPI0034583DE0|nr:two pore domain potassium channel family protein [Nostoc sp. NOS(2021)]
MQDLLPKERRFSFGSISTKDWLIFARILLTLFILVMIILICSVLIYHFEHPRDSTKFLTRLDALYFTVVTMTTVGFGDVAPTSQPGRFLTVVMILIGITLIPWQVANLINLVFKTANQIETDCFGCGLAFHDVNAGFCKMCGAKLPNLNSKIM